MKRHFFVAVLLMLGLLLNSGSMAEQVVSEAGIATNLSGKAIDPASLPTAADAENVELVGHIDTPGIAQGVGIAGGYAYVADGPFGLRIVNISTAANPTEMGFYDTPGQCRGVTVAGDYVYVADGYSGLRIVDVSTPANPREVGFYDTLDARGVAVVGNYAYVADGYYGHGGMLHVVDVSNPTQPTHVNWLSTPGWALDVTVAGHYVYVAVHESTLHIDGLEVMSISTPANPMSVGGFYDAPGYAQDIAVAEGYACVADGGSGLRVVDISSPANPTEVGFYDTPGWAEGVAVAEEYSYVADGDAGLRVVDVSNPVNPMEVGFYDTLGQASGVTVAGNYIYVADGDNGLVILRYEEPGIVPESHADIGMPYSAYRGCPSPYTGCGGPYHGFYYGVCTDLALDAYNAGAPFNIQDALYQNHLAHFGRYRYASARNAEDMRRYFVHNQQSLPHSQAYEPGDVAFFDWGNDGLSDHVGVISEVDGNGRPLRMVHATGVCQVNPGGLAFEQDWNSYYDQYIQGHGRLNESSVLAASADEPLPILRVTVDSSSVTLRLRDANGKSRSASYDENLVATGVETAIPYIPGSWYADRGAEQVISVTWPLSNTGQYFVELSGQAAVTYHLRLEALQGAAVADAQVFTRTLAAGETHGSALTLSAPGGSLQFSATSPTSIPLAGVPQALTLSGLVSASAQATFSITETGNQHTLEVMTLSATDLTDPLGGAVSGSWLNIDPSPLTVPPGESRNVDVQINLAGVAPGRYRGALIARSVGGGPQLIPLTLNVEFHQVYLPIAFKNN